MLKPRLAALLLLANPQRMLDSMLALLKPNQAESRVFTLQLSRRLIRRSGASWVRYLLRDLLHACQLGALSVLAIFHDTSI